MTEESKAKKQIKIQIDVPAEIASGNYANMTLVNHNETEFVIDFIFLQPQTPKAKVSDRLILSPKNAKRFMMVLSQNVRKYEDRFGKIVVEEKEKTDLNLVH